MSQNLPRRCPSRPHRRSTSRSEGGLRENPRRAPSRTDHPPPLSATPAKPARQFRTHSGSLLESESLLQRRQAGCATGFWDLDRRRVRIAPFVSFHDTGVPAPSSSRPTPQRQLSAVSLSLTQDPPFAPVRAELRAS